MRNARIDLNVRTPHGTYVDFEDIDGPVTVGTKVVAAELESGLTGFATVERIDWPSRLVYLNIDWRTLVGPERIV